MNKETGQTYPEMDKLISICKLFKCSLDDLTNDEIEEINRVEKDKITISKLIDEILDTISRSIYIFRKLSFTQMLESILGLSLLILILVLLKLPIGYIYQLGASIFDCLGPNFAQILSSIWNFILSISYLIFAIICFYYLYKTLFLEKWEQQKQGKEETIEKKKSNKESKEEPIVVSDSSKDKNKTTSLWQVNKKPSMVLKVLNSIVSFFIKMCLVLIVFPFLLSFFLIIIALILGVYLMFHRIIYLGIFFLLFSGLMFSYLIIKIIFNMISNHTNSPKRIGITFLISVILLGIGVGISLIEFSQFTYYDSDFPSTELYEIEYFEREVEMNEDFAFHIIGSYREVEYIEFPDYIDTIRFEVGIYKNFNTVNFEYGLPLSQMEHHLWIHSEPRLHIFNPKTREIVFESLRNKKLYNYDYLGNMHVKIYTSKENINQIKLKIQEQENIEDALEDEKEKCNGNIAEYEQLISEYQYSLEEKENIILELESQIQQLETELEDTKRKIKEYKEQISSIIEE